MRTGLVNICMVSFTPVSQWDRHVKTRYFAKCFKDYTEKIFSQFSQPYGQWSVPGVLLPLSLKTQGRGRGSACLTPILHSDLFLDVGFRWCYSNQGFLTFPQFLQHKSEIETSKKIYFWSICNFLKEET